MLLKDGINFTFSFKSAMTNHSNKEEHQPAPNPNAAQSGNASNPSPQTEPSPMGEQLISAQGEKYLREVANIEDYPDAQDQQKMDESREQNKPQ